jgi:hypothetical protein
VSRTLAPRLKSFVDAVVTFLGFVLSDPQFEFLWQDDLALGPMAKATFAADVRPAAEVLKAAIPGIPQQSLADHGLIGDAMHFKLMVMDAIGRKWTRVSGGFGIRDWFRRIVEAIDAALQSLVSAAGVGGLLVEFKDALLALGGTAA